MHCRILSNQIKKQICFLNIANHKLLGLIVALSSASSDFMKCWVVISTELYWHLEPLEPRSGSFKSAMRSVLNLICWFPYNQQYIIGGSVYNLRSKINRLNPLQFSVKFVVLLRRAATTGRRYGATPPVG